MNDLEVKAAIRARDGFACTDCGMTNDQHLQKYRRVLDVHRVNPGSEYTIEGCVTLCRSCHAKEPKNDHNTDAHTGHLLPSRAPDPLWSVLQAIAKAERRSVAQTVLILLEEAVAARGHTLPPSDVQE